MTQRGTFIINGVERVVVSQLHRSPGVYFTEGIHTSGKHLFTAKVIPYRGPWIEFTTDVNDLLLVSLDKRRKFPATMLLRALDYSSSKENNLSDTSDIIRLYFPVEKKKIDPSLTGRILAKDSVLEENSEVLLETGTELNQEHLSLLTSRGIKEVHLLQGEPGPDMNILLNTLKKDPTRSRREALDRLHLHLRGGLPVSSDAAEAFVTQLFFTPHRYDLRNVGRFKINQKLGLSIDPQTTTLHPQDIVAAIQYLFKLVRGEGSVDDIDHLSNRRLRRVGELVASNAFRIGLLRLERSVKEKMSLISLDDEPLPANLINARPLIASLNEFFRSSQLSAILDDTNPLSEIDILRRITVLGPGGINRERASFSIRDVNSSQYGRIDPVRTPEGPNIGLVTYLALYARVNEYGFIEAPYRRVKKTKRGRKTRVKVTDEIVYIAADDEENHHITHASLEIDGWGYITADRVPLRYQGAISEGPSELVDLVDVTPRQVVGASASLIPFLAHDEGNRALMGSNMQNQAVPLVTPEAPIVGTGFEGEIAKGMGRVIHARHSGVVAVVDAEKIEVKLSKKTADESPTEEIEITDGGRFEVYHLTKFKRTSHSTSYNQRVKVSPGQKVKKGDLLADGPAIDGGELALGRNLVIAYTSLEGYGFEDAILISDKLVKEDVLTSIHIEEYEADVVDTKLGPEELTRDIPNVAETDLANLAEDGIVVIGAEVGPNDILVGKIAPKGETELTAEERLLRAIFGEKAREVRDTSLRVPHGERGIVVDVSILDKDKGDELGPGVIKRVIVRVAQMRKITVGDKVAGRHGNKGVIAKIMPVADMPYLADGTPVDIVISPLSVLARMNLGQLLECHVGWALSKKGEKAAFPVFDKIGEDTVARELESAGLPATGKAKLYDGKTGRPFKEDTVIGIGYILKLTHMVEDKTHARSTGPYSLVTQQPLGGKAQMGGQRLGEMEVWGLEAHRAAYILQEMLTIKSDDVLGRARAFEAIVKGVDIPEATVPESFKVLVRELNALGLSIDTKGEVFIEETPQATSEGEELAFESGAKVVATKALGLPEGPMEVEVKK